MKITKYNCNVDYIKKIQQYAKTIAPSIRIVFNDMTPKNQDHICISYEIDVHEANKINEIEYQQVQIKPKLKWYQKLLFWRKYV